MHNSLVSDRVIRTPAKPGSARTGGSEKVLGNGTIENTYPGVLVSMLNYVIVSINVTYPHITQNAGDF
jgi:hypothetical protein